MEDIIIVGAGPIGLYAGILAALHNLKGVIIESEGETGGQLTKLYPEKDIIDLPGFSKITAKDFIIKLKEQYEAGVNKLPIHYHENITNFEKVDDHFVVISNKNKYEAKCILIATGMGAFMPRKIGVPNEDSFSNIHYSINNKHQFVGHNVIVLGGGDSAVDWSLMLQECGAHVTIVHRRNEFRAQSSSVEKMKEEGITILTPFNVHELKGNDGNVSEIVLKNAQGEDIKTISCDDIIVNYGMIPAPNTFPVEKVGNTIKIKEAYETSIPNVFAIGNIINYPGKVKNITCGLGEAVVAITKIDQIINPNKNIPVHF